MDKTEAFPVIDISDWRLAGVEPTGLTPHYWYRQPDAPELWLFKPVESPDGRVLGDDWSEKVASEIAALMGLPAARVEFAQRASQSGCISQNLIPRRWEMQQGAVLLAGAMPGYRSRVKGRTGHSTANIQYALAGFGPPPGSALPASFDAYDVFVGYMVFDALIANKDRHDGNWAVLRPPSGISEPDALCGSFDHASSLGFNLTDQERSQRIANQLVRQWALRGDAYRFEYQLGSRPPSLVDHALEACSRARGAVGNYWLERVADLTEDSIARILAAILDLSEPTATFISQLLMINKGRLLNER